jgi:hypothetical protein
VAYRRFLAVSGGISALAAGVYHTIAFESGVKLVDGLEALWAVRAIRQESPARSTRGVLSGLNIVRMLGLMAEFTVERVVGLAATDTERAYERGLALSFLDCFFLPCGHIRGIDRLLNFHSTSHNYTSSVFMLKSG